MKVDFFIIGPPRCASTSLAAVLDAQSKVCFARPKEPTYFCKDIPAGDISEMVDDEEYHQKHFGHYEPRKHELAGEGTPLYLMSSVAIDRILEYNPAAKFIGMVRNPVDIVYSMHQGRVRAGLRHENIPNFEEAWGAQEERRHGRRLPKNPIREAVLQYRELGALGSQYQRLFERVERKNIHIIEYESLAENFKVECELVFDFLGLDAEPLQEIPHREANAIWVNSMARRSFQMLLRLSAMLPVKPKIGIIKAIRSKLIRETQRDPLRPEFEAELKNEFLSEIELLEELLGRDYSHWKQ